MKVYVLYEVEKAAGMVIEVDTIGVFATYEGAAKHSGLDGTEFLLYDAGEEGRWWVLGDYRIEEHEVQE